MAGITRRDYFAGLAMQTFLSRKDHDYDDENTIAIMAYAVAQAMEFHAMQHDPSEREERDAQAVAAELAVSLRSGAEPR